MIADIICYWSVRECNIVFFRLKDVTNTCKRMRHSLNIGGEFFQCNSGELEEADDFTCVFIFYCALESK